MKSLKGGQLKQLILLTDYYKEKPKTGLDLVVLMKCYNTRG